MKKFFTLLALLAMLFVFAGFLTNCPTVQQPNNLCQDLVYGSDLWSDCVGIYGSEGSDAEADATSAPAVDPVDDSDDDDDSCDEPGPGDHGPSTY